MRTLAHVALVGALAGCQTIDEDTGVWEPAESITGPLAPELGPPPAEVPAPPAALRVVTYNVHFGEDAAGIAATILASREIASAHVIMVQEIEAYPDEPTTRTRRLAEALGMTWAYAPAREQHGGTHGIAILSRFPLEDVTVRKLPFIDTAYRPRSRNALAADIVVGATRVRLVDLHLDVRIGPVDRIRQLRPAVLDQPDPVIIGGDFNTNPWSWIENTVPLTGTEAVVGMDQATIIDDYMFEQDFAGAIAPDVATFDIPVFDMRIDNLYTRGATFTGGGVERIAGSDHWPVWSDIALP